MRVKKLFFLMFFFFICLLLIIGGVTVIVGGISSIVVRALMEHFNGYADTTLSLLIGMVPGLIAALFVGAYFGSRALDDLWTITDRPKKTNE